MAANPPFNPEIPPQLRVVSFDVYRIAHICVELANQKNATAKQMWLLLYGKAFTAFSSHYQYALKQKPDAIVFNQADFRALEWIRLRGKFSWR